MIGGDSIPFYSSFSENFSLSPHNERKGYYYQNFEGKTYLVLYSQIDNNFTLNKIDVYKRQAVSVLLGIVVIGAPVAFAISKLRFKQSKALMSFFLMGMMIPIFASLIPMFRIYNVVGLRNTYLSLILPQIGFNLPISIYLYVGFMKFIPDAIHEAAVIDGAGAFQAVSYTHLDVYKRQTVLFPKQQLYTPIDAA